MFLDSRPDLRVRVAGAGVFHTVCDDDEDHLLGLVPLRHVALHTGDVAHAASQGVEQGGAAADLVVGGGHGAHLSDGQAVADDLGLVVEEHRGDRALAV